MPSKLKGKLEKGEWVSAWLDDTLWSELDHAYKLCQKLNQVERDSKEYKTILVKLLGKIGENTRIRAPFFVDYGYNIYIGKNCFINYDCVILDVAKVEIGDKVWIGPGVHIYAVEHKIKPEERNIERGVPVIIEDDVWIGGHATILPGVKVGRGSLIGAGSVVTKNVEEMTVVAGNPAHKVRKL
jgi:maltose O-acetyltransferase